MEYLALPLSILAFAILIWGFPKIHIGKKEIHKHYHKKDKE